MTFLDLLRDFNVPFKRHGESSKVSEGWSGFPCPFCRHVSQDGDPYLLGVSPSGAISCYYCGRHAPGETLAALAGIPLPRAIELTRGTTRGALPPAAATAGKFAPPPNVGPLLPPHRDYLASRGFDPDTVAALWGVGGIGASYRLAWRLYIPVMRGGKAVSWTTRKINDRAPGSRYVGAGPREEAVPRRELLYGECYCRHAVVVVEGPAGVWRIGPGAAATLGVGYTAAQVVRIGRYPVRAICFDSEAAAQRRARKLCRELSALPGQTHRVELDAADPGEAGAAEVRELRRSFLE